MKKISLVLLLLLMVTAAALPKEATPTPEQAQETLAPISLSIPVEEVLSEINQPKIETTTYFSSLALHFSLLTNTLEHVAEAMQVGLDVLSSAPEESTEYRAMWISYLELAQRDLSTKEKFHAEMYTMFSQCKSLGLNRVIVQVRPFGDALYPSDIYPWSDFISGTQGVAPDFDPLEEMITLAHSMGLQFEAWVNPYRARLNNSIPTAFSADNPANNSEFVWQVGEGIYYNPALPEVQAMVVEGIREIVENYDVDGIHMDDYFYPSTDLSLDKEEYLASGTILSQGDWRRENVNNLVRTIYATVKSIDPSVKFGVSPQGNNDNNYNSQYSDVNLWLSTPGYVDYIIPQIYWGFDFILSNGSTKYQYLNALNMWNDYPRHQDVELYIGLAAYRIGDGDGSSYTKEEWNSGRNIAEMILALRELELHGYVLFRHDFLFNNASHPNLAQAECEAMKEIN